MVTRFGRGAGGAEMFDRPRAVAQCKLRESEVPTAPDISGAVPISSASLLMLASMRALRTANISETA